MKVKAFIGCILIAALLALASPALAASLGISPSNTELEVPGDGSTVANFKVHYYSGDLKISLVDIPLRVEPETLHIVRSSEPVDIELTIYGDESLGSQVYDGYVRFLGMTGETVAVAVEVKAKVNHIVAGQPLPEEKPPEEAPPEQVPPPGAEAEGFPVIPIAGIAAGAAIVITLIVVFARRRQY